MEEYTAIIRGDLVPVCTSIIYSNEPSRATDEDE